MFYSDVKKNSHTRARTHTHAHTVFQRLLTPHRRQESFSASLSLSGPNGVLGLLMEVATRRIRWW